MNLRFSRTAQWFLYIGVFSFGLLACSKEKDPAPVTVLTIHVTPDFFPQATDNWVFITNESGDVLDIENIQNGTTYTLMASPGVDEFTVTFFKQYGDAPWTWFNFESFEGIAKSTVMTLDYPASTNFHNTTGIANFTIDNYTASNAPTEKIWFSTGYSAGQSVQLSSAMFDNNTFTVPGYIGEAPTDFFITAYNGDEPVYAFVEGVELSDNISLDFNSFSAFDHTIKPGGN